MGFDIQSDSLLSIEEICNRLSISRRTFDRLRGASVGASRPGLAAVVGRSGGPMLSAGIKGMPSREDRELDGLPPFPEPTVTLGRNPRWSAKAVNDWIARTQLKRQLA